MSRHSCRQASTHPFTNLLATTALLTACGGGGSSGGAPEPEQTLPPDPIAITTVAVSGTVADGPLSGATVCYDLNDNATCDTDEPASTPTDADGRYVFLIDSTLAGKHAVVAEVPATAVDKDTGAAVGTAYTLQAPASGLGGPQSVFVSPLTTLVQTQVALSGSEAAAAADFVRAQAGLALSPLVDFTASLMKDNPDAHQAAAVARLAMATWLAQSAVVSGVVGQTDLSGSVASAKDLRQAVAQAVLAHLPAIGASAAEPAISQAPDLAARTKALGDAASSIVSAQTSLTPANALAVIGLAKLPADTAADAPSAGASLPIFRFVDADNWYFRAFLSTVADNTPDAEGLLRFYDLRSQRSAGVAATWGFGASKEREGDLIWNGSGWVSCPLGTRSTVTPRDAQGRASNRYCDGFEQNISTQKSVDIAGKTLRNVVETIRSFPGSYGSIAYADWGPRDLAQLGDASFPPGSTLRYQTSTAQRTAPAYDARESTALRVYPAEIAAGGDARGSNSPPCRAVNSNTSAGFLQPVTSLDELVARNPGTPCLYNPTTSNAASSGEQNDWWGNGTVNLGSVGNAVTRPADTGTFYGSTELFRLAFVPGTASVKVYSCLQRQSDGSARNCTAVGGGSYAVQTLGDARVMSFTGLPATTLRSGSERVFVERGGKVFAGYRNPVGIPSPTVRLNLPATNAVFSQLGLPALVP